MKCLLNFSLLIKFDTLEATRTLDHGPHMAHVGHFNKFQWWGMLAATPQRTKYLFRSAYFVT